MTPQVTQCNPDLFINMKNHVCLVSVSVASVKEVRSGKTTEALKNKDIAVIYPDGLICRIIFVSFQFP